MSENQKIATRIVTGKVRLAYAHLFEPYLQPGATEAKYSCALLVDKNDKETIASLQLARASAVEAKFGANPPKNLKSTIKDGDQYEDNDDFKGCLVINVSSKYQPGIVDRKLQPIMDSTEVYSGCYVRASLNAYAYDHPTGGKGVSFGLNHIMKWEDGDFLGGRSRAEDDFGDLVDLGSGTSESTASNDLAGLL